MSDRNVLNYGEHGGSRQVIGGSLDVVSGGEIDIESGGALKIAGTDLAAALAGTIVAAGSSITLDSTYHGRVIALDTAAGSTVTLPAATGSGVKFTFIVTVKPTTNQHRLNVVGNDAFAGSVNIIDMDGSAQAAFAALVASDNDRCDLNGTTKGGQIGDMLEVIDINADVWHIRGQLICPAGSNPATPFATGQVS